jgi:hypothetical protein
MGDVGAVATLINTLLSWALNPDGYAQMSRDQKLEHVHDTMLKALAAGQYDTLDQLLAELRRLQQTSA